MNEARAVRFKLLTRLIFPDLIEARSGTGSSIPARSEVVVRKMTAPVVIDMGRTQLGFLELDAGHDCRDARGREGFHVA
jgi:hypothetical protein